MILAKRNFIDISPSNLIKDKLYNSRTNEILIIVPTNRKVRYLTTKFIEESQFNAVANPKIHTLSTLSFLLFEELINNEYFILDDATAVIQLKKIFSEVDLQYFPKHEEITQGILLEIKNVISDLKKKGITSSLLKSDLKSLSGSEKTKAEDLIKIYESFQSECIKKKLFELGDIYELINRADKNDFNAVFKNLFYDVDTVIIEGFDEFTSPEIKIINSICELIDNSFIIFDFDQKNEELSYHISKSVEKLKNLAFSEVKELSKNSSNSLKSILQENLFTILPTKNTTDVKIYLNPCQNRIDEITFTAKLIKILITEGKYSADEICVIFNQIGNYSKIINEVFEDFGVPFNLTDRFVLSDSPPVISIINFLEILENNFYYKNIFRALSGRWIEIPTIDKENLLKVSVNLKIVSNFENWLRKIDNVLEEFQNNLDYDFMYLSEDSYLKAKQDILTLKNYLEPFDKLLTPSDFLKEINSLITKLEIISKTANDHELYIEKNTRALTEFVDMLTKITQILEVEYGNKKHNLTFYLDIIKSATQFTRYNVRENSGVLITTTDEIRGLNFKFVILGGLVDGEFPTRYKPEIFIPHKYKVFEEGHIAKERYKFYQALSVAEKEIVLNFPQNDENAEFTISSFVNDLKSLVDIKILDRMQYDLNLCSSYEIKKKLTIQEIEAIYKEGLNNIQIDLDNVKRKCEFDYQRRNNPFDEIDFNGYLNCEDEPPIKDLLEEITTQNQYSATRLEDYVKCPFQYLLKRILNLQPFKEPVEEVEAFEIGTLVHSILYEFYTNIKEKNIVIENCSDQQFEELQSLIFNIAESKIKKENFSNAFSFFELEKILGINNNREFSVLYKFLEQERKSKNGFTPFMFEKKFGSNYRDAQVEVNQIFLQGSIDRIDVNIKEKLFSVIDYKLRGKKISKEDINEGIFLQLSLYLYAAKKLLELEFNDIFEPYSAEIYSLKLSKNEFGRKIIHNSTLRNLETKDLININNQMIDIFLETINKSLEKIKRGEFHLSTLKKREEKVCNYCNFISVCRVQEII